MKIAYRELADHLSQGNIAPVYALSGEQELLRTLARREIQSAVLGQGPTDFNLDKFDGDVASVDQVIMACNLLPMLGGRRLVVARRAAGFVEGGKRSGGETAPERLLAYVRRPSPSTVLVLELEKSPDGRRKAWREMRDLMVVVECLPLKEWEVEPWLTREAERRGLRLDGNAQRYLAGEFGTDLRRQLNELEKISLYAGERNVGVEEIAHLLGRGRAQSIFRFTDAVASREAGTALKQLGRLLEEGEPPLRILSLLDRTVGQLLVAKETRFRGRGAGELVRALGVPPRAAENIRKRSELFEEQELVNAMVSLARCDRTLKTTGAPPRLVLETWVISVCGDAGRGVPTRKKSAEAMR